MNAITAGKNTRLSSCLFRFAYACLIAVALFAATDAAYAFPSSQCAADRKGSNLGCNAQDVHITNMSIIGDTTSCIGGSSVTMDMQATINFAQPSRYDIGIFIANDGKNPATLSASGGAATCAVSVLPTASPFLNLDGGATGDTCGDGNSSIGDGSGSGIHYLTNVTVLCQSVEGASGNLYIPFVVSWDNLSTTPGDLCTSNADPVPSTQSKCNAPTIVQGSVAVAVLPTITNSDGVTTIFSGSATSYNVTITNTTGASLSGALFKDPAVSGIAVNTLSCSAAGGASCPVSPTVAAMQGAGITIPTLPTGDSVTFTIGATLTGSPGNTRTNTATVTVDNVAVGNQTNAASDTDTIVDTFALLPTSQAKSGDAGAVVPYSYTLYNYGSGSATINLSAISSRGWNFSLNPASVIVAAGGSAAVTLNLTVGGGAVGAMDTTTIAATSPEYPGKTVTATAVTTKAAVLTLTPSNTGYGGRAASVYYSHRVQNNDASRTSVSLTPVLTGSCSGWSSALYLSDRATPLTSPVTLAVSGGYLDFVLKVSIPPSAAIASQCTATLTAAFTSGAANSVSVTDVTTVKDLLLYSDGGYTEQSYIYPSGSNVYAMTYGVVSTTNYEYRWYDSNGTEVCAPRQQHTTGATFPDTCAIPVSGPLGTWRSEVWNTDTGLLFDRSYFYVGPDHLQASYSGGNPAIGANVVIDLALHDRYNHVEPKDSSNNLIIGNPPSTKDPTMVTVTVSGSAMIISTTLSGGAAVISGQSVTGWLDRTTGTATLTISDSVAETVTVAPVTYNGALYGSPTRDENATVIFAPAVSGPDHYELSLPASGITCLPITATITACADVSSPCTNPLTTLEGQTATLATTGGALVPTTVIFNASGIASAALSYPAAVDGAVASVTLSGEQTAATNPRKCCPGGINCAVANSCSATFNTAGFIFAGSADGGVTTIPTQVSGVSDGTYYLRAVKTNTTTRACEAALAGTSAIYFAYECNNPAICDAANLMSVNGGTATTISRNNNGSVSSYTPASMTFDTNGNAPFTFVYSDVGQVRLWVSKMVNSALLTGSTNNFVVKPHHFDLSAIMQTVAPNLVNPAAINAAGAKFVRAGEQFSVTVTARNALGGATASYGRETAPESVRLASALAGGLGLTSNPTLAGAFGSFSNGVATGTAFTWNEAGIIRLTPSVGDGDYLGAGDTSGTQSGNIGRFHAAKFVLSGGVIANRTGLAGCAAPAGCDTFTYMGEQMSAVFNLTAKAVDGTTTLQNYNYSADEAKNFARFEPTATGNPLVLAAVDTGTPRTVATLDTATYGTASGSFGSVTPGVASITAPFTVTRGTSPYGQFDALDVGVVPVDGDGATLATLDLAVNAGGAPNTHGKVGSTRARFGRMVLYNAYGSELLNLTIPLKAQYWKCWSPGSCVWAVNDLDSATDIGMGNIRLSNFAVTINDVVLTGMGQWNVVLDKPSVATNTGLCVDLDAGATGDTTCMAIAPLSMPYLQTGATYNMDPVSRATFGVYGGRNEFIYRGRHGR